MKRKSEQEEKIKAKWKSHKKTMVWKDLAARHTHTGVRTRTQSEKTPLPQMKIVNFSQSGRNCWIKVETSGRIFDFFLS